eukprot:15474832-Alexandrium_andersonii.AAC.1
MATERVCCPSPLSSRRTCSDESRPVEAAPPPNFLSLGPPGRSGSRRPGGCWRWTGSRRRVVRQRRLS